jgi:hypothetical protein
MAAAEAIRGPGGGPLGRWVIGPPAGLALLVAVSTQLGSHHCNGGGLTSETLGIVFEVIGLGGAAVLVGAGLWRIAMLVRRRGGRRWADRRIVAVVLLVLLAFAVFTVRGNGLAEAAILGVLLLGLLVTVFCFLAVTVAWFQHQEVDEVGLLLPAYLIGSGLLVYLPVVGLVAAIVGGCWGE